MVEELKFIDHLKLDDAECSCQSNGMSDFKYQIVPHRDHNLTVWPFSRWSVALTYIGSLMIKLYMYRFRYRVGSCLRGPLLSSLSCSLFPVATWYSVYWCRSISYEHQPSSYTSWQGSVLRYPTSEDACHLCFEWWTYASTTIKQRYVMLYKMLCYIHAVNEPSWAAKHTRWRTTAYSHLSYSPHIKECS